MRRTDGFSLVELLVVILVIGILAAIAIPSFLGQRLKAADTEAKTSALTAQKAMETYRLDHGGKFTGATVNALIDIEPTLTGTPGLALPVLDADNYAIQVDSRGSDGGGGPYYIARLSDERVYRACVRPSTGGCGKVKNVPGYPGYGSW